VPPLPPISQDITQNIPQDNIPQDKPQNKDIIILNNNEKQPNMNMMISPGMSPPSVKPLTNMNPAPVMLSPSSPPLVKPLTNMNTSSPSYPQSVRPLTNINPAPTISPPSSPALVKPYVPQNIVTQPSPNAMKPIYSS